MMTMIGHTGIIWNRVPDRRRSKKNERSPSVALLCAGLLRRCMVYELERVLRVCDGFYAACQQNKMEQ